MRVADRGQHVTMVNRRDQPPVLVMMGLAKGASNFGGGLRNMRELNLASREANLDAPGVLNLT